MFVNHMHSFLLVLTHLDNEASNLEETVNDEGDSKCGNCGQCGIGQPSVIVVIVSSEGALYVILPYDYPAAQRPLFEHTPVLNNNFEH